MMNTTQSNEDMHAHRSTFQYMECAVSEREKERRPRGVADLRQKRDVIKPALPHTIGHHDNEPW